MAGAGYCARISNLEKPCLLDRIDFDSQCLLVPATMSGPLTPPIPGSHRSQLDSLNHPTSWAGLASIEKAQERRCAGAGWAALQERLSSGAWLRPGV